MPRGGGSKPFHGERLPSHLASSDPRALYHILVKVVQIDVPDIKANSSLAKQGSCLPEYINESTILSRLF